MSGGLGSILGGGSEGTKSTTTSTVTLPDWLLPSQKDIVKRATSLSNTPYEAYQGQRVAGLNADQTNSFNLARDLVGQGAAGYNPSIDISKEVAERGLNGFSQQELQQWMNPYTENVLDINRRRQFENYDQTMNDVRERAGQAGSFGGSRFGLQEAQSAKNFQQQLSDFDQQGLYSAYNDGMNRAMAGTTMAGQAGMDMAKLNQSQISSNQQDIANLQNIGGIQRQYDQANLDVNYENFLKEKAYPYEQVQWLSGVTSPIAGMMKGQNSVQTQEQMGGGGSLLGTALGIGSMMMGIPGVGAAMGGGLGSLAGGMGMSSGLASSIGSFMGGGAGSAFTSNALFSGMGGFDGGGYGLGNTLGFRDGGMVTRNAPRSTDLVYGTGYSDGGIVGKLDTFAQFLQKWNSGNILDALKDLPTLANDGSEQQQEQGGMPNYTPGGSLDMLQPQQQASRGGGMPEVKDQNILDTIRAAAEKHGIPVNILANLVKNESNFNPKAVSPVGAQGLAQLMPDTAKELGVTNPFDIDQNLHGAAAYLRKLNDKYDGDWRSTLAAYNWGMGNVDRKGIGAAPLETRNYLTKNGFADGGLVGLGFGGVSTDGMAQQGKSWLDMLKDEVSSTDYRRTKDGDSYLDRAGNAVTNAGLGIAKGAAGVAGIPAGVGEFLTKPRYASKESPNAGLATKPSVNPKTAEKVANVVKATRNSPTPDVATASQGTPSQGTPSESTYTPTESPTDEMNIPLIAFGAALLGSDKSFFKALGDAGTTYANSKQKQESAAAEAQQQSFENKLAQFKAEQYAQQVQAQSLSATDPYKRRLNELRVKQLEQKINDGGVGKMRQTILESLLDSGVDPDEAMRQANIQSLRQAVDSNLEAEGAIGDFSTEDLEFMNTNGVYLQPPE